MGNTRRAERQLEWRGKHPHGRGEDNETVNFRPPCKETPPRAWGRLWPEDEQPPQTGNTPTGVGKTLCRQRVHRLLEKHPHGRGEDRDFIVFFIRFYFYSYFKTAASRLRPPLSVARHNRPVDFHLHCRPKRFSPALLHLLQRWRGREGDPGRPKGGRSAAAGADITRPKRPGRSAPTPTRHAAGGVLSNLRDSFHAPAKRGVRGCRGCRGGTPLTPCPSPGRRPAARSGQQPQDKVEEK